VRVLADHGLGREAEKGAGGGVHEGDAALGVHAEDAVGHRAKRPSTALELWQKLGEVPLENPWTPERAEIWWREKLPDLAGAGPGDDPSAELSLDPID